jgi:hypothetical protein
VARRPLALLRFSSAARSEDGKDDAEKSPECHAEADTESDVLDGNANTRPDRNPDADRPCDDRILQLASKDEM